MSPAEPAEASPIPADPGRPGLAEPWQAQLLAMVDQLSRGGAFTPAEWSRALGAVLAQAASEGAPDTADSYYAAVLRALETLLAERGAVSVAALDARRAAWRQAYLDTPHGQPVKPPRG